jgi:DNA-binding NarL/FixJ family response regulator
MSSRPYLGLVSVMPSRTGIQLKEIDRRVRILIADDHPVIRKTVRFTLEQHPRFEVCGEAQDGFKAIEEAQKLKPDVVILNVTMPVLNGFEAAREIKTSLPETAIVILSSNTDQRFIEEAKKIGARAYVAKTELGKSLIKAIEAAVLGGDFIVMD